jgi:hypothetical protein
VNIRIGIWAGGDSSNDEGTIEWAGGATDYANGPYTMVLEKIEVVNETPGKSYTYGDLTGSWESIEVENGESKSVSTISKASGTTASRTATGSGTTKQTGTATSTTSTASTTSTGMWWTASAQAAVSGGSERTASSSGNVAHLGLCACLVWLGALLVI